MAKAARRAAHDTGEGAIASGTAGSIARGNDRRRRDCLPSRAPVTPLFGARYRRRRLSVSYDCATRQDRALSPSTPNNAQRGSAPRSLPIRVWCRSGPSRFGDLRQRRPVVRRGSGVERRVAVAVPDCALCRDLGNDARRWTGVGQPSDRSCDDAAQLATHSRAERRPGQSHLLAWTCVGRFRRPGAFGWPFPGWRRRMRR